MRTAVATKAVGVDVDLDARGAGGPDAGEPIAQDRLEAHVAARLDAKPAALAAAQPEVPYRAWCRPGAPAGGMYWAKDIKVGFSNNGHLLALTILIGPDCSTTIRLPLTSLPRTP